MSKIFTKDLFAPFVATVLLTGTGLYNFIVAFTGQFFINNVLCFYISDLQFTQIPVPVKAVRHAAGLNRAQQRIRFRNR